MSISERTEVMEDTQAEPIVLGEAMAEPMEDQCITHQGIVIKIKHTKL